MNFIQILVTVSFHFDLSYIAHVAAMATLFRLLLMIARGMLIVKQLPYVVRFLAMNSVKVVGVADKFAPNVFFLLQFF